MADRPILFSAPMVRALLAGTKTQTRRLVSFAGIENVMDFVKVATDKEGRPVYEMKGSVGQHIAIPAGKHLQDYNWSPRIGVSDRLWVRESIDKMSEKGDTKIGYMADWPGDGRGLGWRPSIHMPRWASRLTLTVTDIRVERLLDISEHDARAEGVEPAPDHPGWWKSQTEGEHCPTARDAYGDLWNVINGEGAWQVNPWVLAYTFTVHRGNIDQIGGA